jgi:hypothetical protein
MPRKRPSDTTLPAADVAGVEKPKRTRARSTTTTRHTARAQAAATSISNPPVLDSGEIARLAYSFWEARGGHAGSPEQDWRRAERELRQRGAVTAAG